MKLNRKFVVGILLFLVALFILEMQLPKNFSWAPSFRHTDKQPFGCCLFDSLLSATLPQGYTVTDSSLYQLAQDSLPPRGILVVADELMLADTDVKALMTLADNGSHVMLVSHDMSDLVRDTLKFTILGYGNAYNLQQFVKYNSQERIAIRWESRQHGYEPLKYKVLEPLVTRHLRFYRDNDEKYRRPPLEQQASVRNECVSATFRQGKGYITVCSVPLLFTNYGIVDEQNAGFSLRLLTLLKDLPVVRTEAFCPKANTAEQSPLRYFLAQPPLRWAVYVAMVGALLYLVFAGRRRQRVIPVEQEPENHSLEFIRLVGSLYYHSHQRRSLVQRKWTYFAEELRRSAHLDVTDPTEDDQTLPALARMTGMEPKEVRNLILRLRQLAADDDEQEISTKQMKHYIDQMQLIVNSL